MNWNKLKENYPNSEKELRVFSEDKKLNNSFDSKILIENYLKTKGFDIVNSFIKQLKENESNLNKKELSKWKI